MRRVGNIENVRRIEELLKANRGTRIRKGTGNRGDYRNMGETSPSRKRVTAYNIPLALVVTIELDERSGEGGVRIKDDNVGRLCNKVPGLLDLLALLSEEENGQRGFVKEESHEHE